MENYDAKGIGSAPFYEFLSSECADRLARVTCAFRRRDSGRSVGKDVQAVLSAGSVTFAGHRGTGPGLAIVRQMAATNGWKALLTNRATDGLEVVLEIRR